MSTVWTRDAHTKAKHELLRRYLNAWFPIPLQGGHPKICYVEGFAGPGVYDGGAVGSPVIALDVFLGQQRHLAAGRLDVVLLEERTDRVARLRTELRRRLGDREVPNLAVTVERGHCGADLLTQLRRVDALGVPTFAFLDSFGGPDVPYSLIRQLGSQSGSEVLVTFGTAFSTRFGSLDPHATKIDAAFGSSDWRRALTLDPGSKREFLVSAYKDTLLRAGFRYALAFEMVDEGGRPLFLIFGTKHIRGLEKMKEAMWSIDPHNGVRFRDPKDPGQGLLDLAPEPNLAPLSRILLEELRRRRAGTHATLREFTLIETSFRETHATRALRDLLSGGQIVRSPARGRLLPETLLRLAEQAPGPHKQGALFDD